MKLLTIIFTCLLVLIAAGASMGVFVVAETESAFRLRFGSPVGHVIRDPGLHIRVPFIETVVRYDNRVLDFESNADLVPTQDKKYIYVDAIARWKITNPLKFYQTIGTLEKAQQILDSIIDSAVSGVVSSYRLVESVRTTNDLIETVKKQQESEQENLALDLEKIEHGREALQKKILQNVQKSIELYGITIIDIRLKKLALEEGVRQKVFERMISERQKIASQIRSEGLGKKSEIEGQTVREEKRIMSEAEEKAESLRGRADAESSQVYAEAHQRNPKFYQFYRNLMSYERSMSEQTTLMMNQSEPYWNLLNGKGVIEN